MTPCSLVRPVDFSLPTFVYVCQACLLLPQGCAEPSFIYEVTGEHCCTVMNFGFIATIPQGAFFLFLPPPPFFFFFWSWLCFLAYCTYSHQTRYACHKLRNSARWPLFNRPHPALRRAPVKTVCTLSFCWERELIFTAFSILWRPHVKAGRKKKINKSYDFSGKKKK